MTKPPQDPIIAYQFLDVKHYFLDAPLSGAGMDLNCHNQIFVDNELLCQIIYFYSVLSRLLGNMPNCSKVMIALSNIKYKNFCQLYNYGMYVI